MTYYQHFWQHILGRYIDNVIKSYCIVNIETDEIALNFTAVFWQPQHWADHSFMAGLFGDDSEPYVIAC